MEARERGFPLRFTKEYPDGLVCLILDMKETFEGDAESTCDKLHNAAVDAGGFIVLTARDVDDKIIGILAVVEKDFEPDEVDGDAGVIVRKALEMVTQDDR